MKKHNSVQGTFSRLFGKKHSSNNSTSSLFVTNPPWVFTQEVKSNTLGSSGEVDDIYYVDNRFGSVTDSGTATLKPRPRVRPLLTFLPLNAQETHGVAVPTPSVPEGFEDKLSPGFGSQIGGNYRKYNSVVDLRPKAFEEDYLDDEYIPPPPSVPPPPPPPPSSTDFSSPPSSMEIPPPPTLPPPPPPPPTMPASSPSSLAPPSDPYSNLSSPSTPSPPDFIPPTPPLAFVDGAGPTSHHIPPFSNGVSKWKSETVLNLREPGTIPHSPNLISPTTPTQKESQVSKSDQDPHLTFPRSLKIPPPTPVRTSSISSGEKDSSPKDEQLPTMVPHSRPALPPHFTIRCANAVHSGGEPERKATLEKPSIVVTESGSPHLPSKSNGSPITQLKHEISSRGKTEPPSTEHASSNDDEDDEHSNLDKLKHELSALLISSLRKEDRTIVPKTKTNITDCNQIITDESKQGKPIVKSKKSPPPIMGEGKEKTDAKISSPSKVITKDVISTPDTMTVQANCVMKFKDELEAVLSPTKDGSPPLGFANLRHNPETKKQVTLQFGGGGQINGEESRLPEPIAYQNNSTSEGIKEDGKTSPSSSSNHISSDNSGKPPVSPQKPKKELLVPAAPSPSSSGTASPIQTASPNVDFSLLQYKTHRMRLGSVDSLASVTSSQTTEDGSGTISNHENHHDSGGRKLSVTSSLSSNTDQTNNEVLFHPVTGEKVERGSPMALLLAAQQRAQKGRSSASASRQNSYLSEKPPLRLSENLCHISQSKAGLSTIYYSDTKPNSVTVVPKTPPKESLVVSEHRQPSATGVSNSSAIGLSECGQKEQRPQALSSASEENKNVQKLPETNEEAVPTKRYSSSSLVQGLLASSHTRQQDPPSMPEAPSDTLRTAQNHTASNKDEEEAFDYEIIPPPPEFSNDTSGIPLDSSVGEKSHISSDSQASDKRLNLSHSGYNSSHSYSLASTPTLENSARSGGYSHYYPGGSYPSSYLSSGTSSRPLIKKRLYMSETDGSYSRAPMCSRSMSSPNTYGHNAMAYSSQAAEGMRRVNSIQRNPNNAQGRRVSLELPGKIVAFSNVSNDAKYKGLNGEYSSAPAAGRSPHGSLSYGGTPNTFTVRPGTRQPISYSYQGLR